MPDNQKVVSPAAIQQLIDLIAAALKDKVSAADVTNITEDKVREMLKLVGLDLDSPDLNLSELTSHVADKNNPHEVTTDSIGAVPTSRTINGQPLSTDVILTAASVKARPDDWTPTITMDSLTGTLPISRGGTGATNAYDALVALSDNLQVTLGRGATNSGSYGISVGNNAGNAAYNGISIGTNAAAKSQSGIAIGANSDVTNSMSSIALGSEATVSGGSMCVAIGEQCKVTITDTGHISGNVAIGEFVNCAGNSSVAIGNSSKTSALAGVALGNSTETKGAYAVALGSGAYASAEDATALGTGSGAYAVDSVALGPLAEVSETYTIQLGHKTKLSNLYCRVNITNGSDIRDKTDVVEIAPGAVRFLNQIRAIQYVTNDRLDYIPEVEDRTEEQQEMMRKYGFCDYDKEAYARGDKKGERKRVGVSAQEVQQALADVYGDASYANLVNDNFYDMDKSSIPEGIENKLSVAYSNFIPFLIKAIQEIDARLSVIEAKL